MSCTCLMNYHCLASGVDAVRKQHRFLETEKARKRGFIILFLGPILLYYVVFLFYPLLSSFIWTFMDYNPIGQNNQFIGLENYRALMADPLVGITLQNTFLLTLYIIPGALIISFIIALALNHLDERMRAVFTTAYFVPVITSMVACAAIWIWLYHPSRGLFNFVLYALGFSTKRWLLDTKLVKPSIAVFTIWKSVGFNAVIFLAALKGIPDFYYEAARLDGASGWKMTKNITLPLLRPAFTFVLVTSVIGTLQIFTQVYVMTSGGPVHASRVLAMYIYERGIRYLEMGYASTLAWVLFVIIMIITLIQMRFLRTDWEY